MAAPRGACHERCVAAGGSTAWFGSDAAASTLERLLCGHGHVTDMTEQSALRARGVCSPSPTAGQAKETGDPASKPPTHLSSFRSDCTFANLTPARPPPPSMLPNAPM
eukprot:scaffold573_cov106-Isochrysis_galbana.AAC.5